MGVRVKLTITDCWYNNLEVLHTVDGWSTIIVCLLPFLDTVHVIYLVVVDIVGGSGH